MVLCQAQIVSSPNPLEEAKFSPATSDMVEDFRVTVSGGHTKSILVLGDMADELNHPLFSVKIGPSFSRHQVGMIDGGACSQFFASGGGMDHGSSCGSMGGCDGSEELGALVETPPYIPYLGHMRRCVRASDPMYQLENEVTEVWVIPTKFCWREVMDLRRHISC